MNNPADRPRRFVPLALGVLLLAAAAPAAPAAQPPAGTAAAQDAIDRLKPGEWYEVPDSKLESVAAPASKFPWLSGGIGGITGCWAGGAFDSQRDRLYIGPGGGHAGYNGNEVYAFDLHDLKWHRLNDPDPVIKGTEYTDLNVAPFAMHTYDGVEYLPPPTDRYLVVGGWGTPRTYHLDPDKPQKWEVYADHGTGRTGDLSAVDPSTGLFWLSTPSTAGKLSQWDPIAKRWTLRRTDSPEASYYETADVDFTRHLLVAVGKGKVKTWGLTPIPQAVPFKMLKTTGGDEVVNHPSPGFCYVPPMDRFVAWAKGADVYSLDVDSGQWTRHPPAATNTVTPGAPDQWGTFGRFRYVASRNVFVLYNAVKQNVFVYRLSDHKPNVIVGVKATTVADGGPAYRSSRAISVRALYADGVSKDVTDRASYFSLTPAVADVDVRGGGVVRGVAPGTARIRAVYTDPAFGRGFASDVDWTITDPLRDAGAAVEKLASNAPALTIVAGDAFALHATADYSTRGGGQVTAPATAAAAWTSDQPDTAAVTAAGVVKALKPGGPVTITATLGGKSAVTRVTVVDAPPVRRIKFGVKDAIDRPGWLADNGQKFSDARGFGWLDGVGTFTTRDDRRAPTVFLKGFVGTKESRFRVKVPAGAYAVKLAMGDPDYPSPPFEEWTAAGPEKLLYYEGHHNAVAVRTVQADADGLTFTVRGKINFLIVAPVGVDLSKHADDSAPADPPAHPAPAKPR